MARKIRTWRDPFGEGFCTCRAREIEIEEGLTVLVGCNGAGKTTLLRNIKQALAKEGIPCASYDNLHDGGQNSISSAIWENDIGFAAAAWTASEGERISANICRLAAPLRGFVMTGKAPSRRPSIFFEKQGDGQGAPSTDERWLLLDAVDSGYSIDNIIELKDLLRLMADDAKKNGKSLYVVAAANSYEMAAGERCLDATTGKAIRFGGYGEYRKFVLGTRKKKNRRIKKLAERKESEERAPESGGRGDAGKAGHAAQSRKHWRTARRT